MGEKVIIVGTGSAVTKTEIELNGLKDQIEGEVILVSRQSPIEKELEEQLKILDSISEKLAKLVPEDYMFPDPIEKYYPTLKEKPRYTFKQKPKKSWSRNNKKKR